jgi:hypothetical protein
LSGKYRFVIKQIDPLTGRKLDEKNSISPSPAVKRRAVSPRQ